MSSDIKKRKFECIQTIKQIMKNNNITLTDIKSKMCQWDEKINK